MVGHSQFFFETAMAPTPRHELNVARMNDCPTMNRRTFLAVAVLLSLCPTRLMPRVGAQPPLSKELAIATRSLLSAPLELGGDWKSTPPQAVTRVLLRVRKVCLSGVKLVSDRQPEKLIVDNHGEGPPAIWLHADPADTAWIILDVAPAAWSQLAYQFGHELGHVLCNSWDRLAEPRAPTQWLEEALAEAFSIRGLGLLAPSWEKNPPFAGDAGYADSIRRYRVNLIEKYKMAQEQEPALGIAPWFHTQRDALENGRSETKGSAALLPILAMLENDRACVEDLGAANRWPARTGIPIEDYLTQWERSCAEVGAAGRLPRWLRALFELD
jgi:hypothetical protein